MKILGIIGQVHSPWAHDGSAALLIDNEIVVAIEQERLTRTRYAVGQGAADAVQMCLTQAGLQLSDVDHIAYGWIPELAEGQKLSDRVSCSAELTHLILPPEKFGYAEPPPIHFVQHHHAHAAVTYYTSGFESAAVLVIDGRGEGESISLYHAKGPKIELLESYPMTYSLGVFYSAAGILSGLGGPHGHSAPGKTMGLAPFGQARQPIGFAFDPDTGEFTLPPSIQKAVADHEGPLLAGHMGRFWHDYFRTHFYPYDSQSGATSPAYDIAHYADLSASVQQTLETICLRLAERVQKLTGEQNLVISGGVALNCTMNAYLSQQNVFENIYVFPAANDAGCSVGAALALAYEFAPPATTPPRLTAPDFGRSYNTEEITAAFQAYGFTPERLCPSTLAERVATDLANDKIVAWFCGRDELGPRALGRRSFMANPAQRTTLGRLNRIKGREMWRPLAPSILEEEAEMVLTGSMEDGLHRYMVGVATIRPEWRTKIPAVVHIDFTCRPHFVREESDGMYWAAINAFYAKSRIPLVCNTSLNVAGQPLVHKPEEVLEIFATQEDVQTVVVEEFYLTK